MVNTPVLEPRIGNMQPVGNSWLATDYRFPYPGGRDYLALFERFALSPHGKHQAQQPLRFSADFGYDRTQMLKDLWTDAHPVDHMWRTYMLATQLLGAELLKYERLEQTPEAHVPQGRELVVVRLAALLHDIGECTHPELIQSVGGVIGDVPFGRKTAAHKKLEAAIRQRLFGQYFKDLPDWLLARSETLIAHGESSPSHDAFQVAHDIGAYGTAIHAGKLALTLRGNTDGERFTQLRALALAVSPRAHADLQPHANTYEMVDTLLYKTDAAFTAIHNQL